MLQKNIRRFVYRHRYLRMREMVLKLQCIARMRIAQSKLAHLQQEKAAIVIQTNYRRFAARQEFLAKKDLALKLQRGEFSAKADFVSESRTQ